MWLIVSQSSSHGSLQRINCRSHEMYHQYMVLERGFDADMNCLYSVSSADYVKWASPMPTLKLGSFNQIFIHCHGLSAMFYLMSSYDQCRHMQRTLFSIREMMDRLSWVSCWTCSIDSKCSRILHYLMTSPHLDAHHPIDASSSTLKLRTKSWDR